MNDALRELAERAGAPQDMLNQLWFAVFCQQFAHLILLAAEEEMQ